MVRSHQEAADRWQTSKPIRWSHPQAFIVVTRRFACILYWQLYFDLRGSRSLSRSRRNAGKAGAWLFPRRSPVPACAPPAELSRMSVEGAPAAAAAASETAAEAKLPVKAKRANKHIHVDAKPMRQRQYEAIMKYLQWVPTKKYARSECPPAVRSLLEKEFTSWTSFRSEFCKHARALLGPYLRMQRVTRRCTL